MSTRKKLSVAIALPIAACLTACGAADDAATNQEAASSVQSVADNGEHNEEAKPFSDEERNWIATAAAECGHPDDLLGGIVAATSGNKTRNPDDPNNITGAKGYDLLAPQAWKTYGSPVDDQGVAVGVPGEGDPYKFSDSIMALSRYLCDIEAKIDQPLSGDDLALVYIGGTQAIEGDEHTRNAVRKESASYMEKIGQARSNYTATR